MIQGLPRGNGMTLKLCEIAIKAEKEGKKVITLGQPAMTEQGLMENLTHACNEGADVPKLDETPKTPNENNKRTWISLR